MSTREPQYQRLVETDKIQRYSLGSMQNDTYYHDPKRIAFTASRYKFVSKMLTGFDTVVEIGCGDGFMSRIVLQEVGMLDLTDFDQYFVEEAAHFFRTETKVKVFQHDLIDKPLEKKYKADYALDVLEHISLKDEERFMLNLVSSLTADGVCVIGMPSRESQVYASELSRAGHVNCKTGKELRECVNGFFESNFIFSMNDEVLHTGYFPMSQYLIALCSHPRSPNERRMPP